MDINLQMLGFSEMMLVHHMVSRVMKSRSTLLVCIMVTVIGHLSYHSRPIIQLLSEEASRYSRELVKDAMELCIRNMIFL